MLEHFNRLQFELSGSEVERIKNPNNGSRKCYIVFSNGYGLSIVQEWHEGGRSTGNYHTPPEKALYEVMISTRRLKVPLSENEKEKLTIGLLKRAGIEYRPSSFGESIFCNVSAKGLDRLIPLVENLPPQSSAETVPIPINRGDHREEARSRVKKRSKPNHASLVA